SLFPRWGRLCGTPWPATLAASPVVPAAGWYALPRKGEAVDFGAVLRVVSAFLDDKGYRFALIGGVALAAYGLARTTLDLDLLVESRGPEDPIAFLEANGFATLHRSIRD